VINHDTAATESTRHTSYRISHSTFRILWSRHVHAICHLEVYIKHDAAVTCVETGSPESTSGTSHRV